MSKTVSGVIDERLEESDADDRVDEVVEHHESPVVVAQSQLARRAQHAVGGDAAHLATGDLEAAGQDRAHRRQRHVVAEVDVHRATHDLQRPVAGVDDHESNAVRALDRANLVDARDHHVLESLADVLDAFDDQAEVIEDQAQFVGRFGSSTNSRSHESEIFTRTAPRIACRSR